MPRGVPARTLESLRLGQERIQTFTQPPPPPYSSPTMGGELSSITENTNAAVNIMSIYEALADEERKERPL